MGLGRVSVGFYAPCRYIKFSCTDLASGGWLVGWLVDVLTELLVLGL